MNAQPAEHPEDPQWILRELPDRERANFSPPTGEPWTVREIRPDGDIRGGMQSLGLRPTVPYPGISVMPRNNLPRAMTGMPVGESVIMPNGYCSFTSSLMVTSPRKFGRY